jgi:hypothetical protein
MVPLLDDEPPLDEDEEDEDDDEIEDFDEVDVVPAVCAARAAIPPASPRNAATESAPAATRDRAAACRRRAVPPAGRRPVPRRARGVAFGSRMSMSVAPSIVRSVVR